MWRVLAILLVIFGAPATGQGTAAYCNVLARLGALDAAMADLEAVLGQSGQAARLEAVQAMVDQAATLRAGPDGQGTVAPFLASRRKALVLVRAAGPGAAAAYMSGAEYIAQGQGLAAAIEELSCDERRASTPGAATGQLRGEGGDVGSGRPVQGEAAGDRGASPSIGPRLRAQLRGAGLSVSLEELGPILGAAAALVAISVLWFLKHKRDLRRARRYPCAISATVLAGPRTVPTEVVDLSLSGAKLAWPAGAGAMKGATLGIGLPTGVHTGRVAWSNQHYTGVMFQVPMSQAELSDLLRLHSRHEREAAPAVRDPPAAAPG